MHQHLTHLAAAAHVGNAVTVSIPWIVSIVWIACIISMLASHRTTKFEVFVLAGGGLLLGATFPALQTAGLALTNAIGMAVMNAIQSSGR